MSSGCFLTSPSIERATNSTPNVGGETSDQEDERPVLSSLEAVVAPVAKLQVSLLSGFAPSRIVHETTAPVQIALLTPQNNYLRTLFRLITPANAP